MMRQPDKVAQFERHFRREQLATMSYAEALDVFAALWQEATAVNPGFAIDWEKDVEPDLAVARAVNGLSAT